jgi:hypothetical protein
MGTSPAFVAKILRGNHNWSLDTLAKAGTALGLQWLVVTAPIDELKPDDAEATPTSGVDP